MDPNNPGTVPDGYVTVTFTPGQGSWKDDTQPSSYYVQKNVEITVADFQAVTDNLEAPADHTFSKWDGFPEDGQFTADQTLTATYADSREIIEVTPKDPAQPFNPENPDDGNNSQNTPQGFVRVIFESGEGGTFGKYAGGQDKLKVAYDVKADQTWAKIMAPSVTAKAGYTAKPGAELWNPQLPVATETVSAGTYTAQYTKQTPPQPTTYTLTYDENGGKNGPTAEMNLAPGKHPLSTIKPTHGKVDEKAVVFVGWTEEKDDMIHAKDSTSFDIYKLRTEVEVKDGDKTVYALWGYDEDDNGKADVFENTAVITFRVSHGKWSDGTTSDKMVTVTLVNGKGTLDSKLIPTGMTADSGYYGGSWDRTPNSTVDAVTGAVTYIYSFHRSSSGGSSGGSGATKYTLTYESNGGTEYHDERYSSGTTVKLDKTPTREGYIFTGWYADKKLTDEISRIRMDRNKTVYAGWEKSSPMQELNIPSLLNGEEHYAYVAGYTDGTVRPLNDITRAEVAMIFYRLLKEDVREAEQTTQNTFTDVTEEMWCNTAISTIARLGIVQGRSATVFDPNAPITRAEFATICARFDTSVIQGTEIFSDIEGCWAKDYIEHAAALGWVKGYSDGTFRPNNHITRAEAMCMINRVLGRLPEAKQDLLPGMKTWPDNPESAWYYFHVQEATNSHAFERKADGVHEKWVELK